jgi:spermidine/putrescine transport system substrate-binding protein
VVYDEFASNEEMYAKIMAANRKGIFARLFKIFTHRYDIVFPSKDYVPIMISQGLLEQIDKTKMFNLGNIDPEVLKLAVYDPEMKYAVPYYYGAAGILVNTSKVPVYEQSWSIFARSDLKGRMTMLDDMREVMGGALAYLNYSVNTLEAGQIDAARDIINNVWKPNLVKFDSDTFGKGYDTGDFWVVHGFPENVYEEIEGNLQLMKDTVFFIPKEGGPSYIDNMCILKGSENIDLAHQFIDFIHRPEIYAEFVDNFGFPATVNVPARSKKTGNSWYSIDDLEKTELVEEVGLMHDYYNNAWFNVIKAGD